MTPKPVPVRHGAGPTPADLRISYTVDVAAFTALQVAERSPKPLTAGINGEAASKSSTMAFSSHAHVHQRASRPQSEPDRRRGMSAHER